MNSPVAQKKTPTVSNESRTSSVLSRALQDSQSSIQDSFKAITKLQSSSKRARELTESVAFFIGKDLQPISVVQGEGFKRMINCFELGTKYLIE